MDLRDIFESFETRDTIEMMPKSTLNSFLMSICLVVPFEKATFPERCLGSKVLDTCVNGKCCYVSLR